MITITIEGNNGQEIAEKLSEMLAVFSGSKEAKKIKKEPEPEEDLLGETKSGVSVEEVTKAVQKAATSGKREQVKELLKKYKAKNVTSLDAKDYQAFYDELDLV